MHVVYRFIMVMFGLALVAVAGLAATQPRPVVETGQVWLSAIDRAVGTPEYWSGLAGLFAFGGLLLVLAAAGRRHRELIVATDAGTVELQPAVVGEQIRQRLEALEGVHAARVDVLGRGHKADVVAHVDVTDAALDAGVAPRLTRAAREAVEGGTGLKLGRLRLDLRHVAAPERDEPMRRAA